MEEVMAEDIRLWRLGTDSPITERKTRIRGSISEPLALRIVQNFPKIVYWNEVIL